jgi:hypothetical protein
MIRNGIKSPRPSEEREKKGRRVFILGLSVLFSHRVERET